MAKLKVVGTGTVSSMPDFARINFVVTANAGEAANAAGEAAVIASNLVNSVKSHFEDAKVINGPVSVKSVNREVVDIKSGKRTGFEFSHFCATVYLSAKVNVNVEEIVSFLQEDILSDEAISFRVRFELSPETIKKMKRTAKKLSYEDAESKANIYKEISGLSNHCLLEIQEGNSQGYYDCSQTVRNASTDTKKLTEEQIEALMYSLRPEPIPITESVTCIFELYSTL